MRFWAFFPGNNCIQYLHQEKKEEQGSDLDRAVSPVPAGDAETSSVLALAVQLAPGGRQQGEPHDKDTLG